MSELPMVAVLVRRTLHVWNASRWDHGNEIPRVAIVELAHRGSGRKKKIEPLSWRE